MADTNSIRKRLHQYLEVADDMKVKALYAIIEGNGVLPKLTAAKLMTPTMIY